MPKLRLSVAPTNTHPEQGCHAQTRPMLPGLWACGAVLWHLHSPRVRLPSQLLRDIVWVRPRRSRRRTDFAPPATPSAEAMTPLTPPRLQDAPRLVKGRVLLPLLGLGRAAARPVKLSSRSSAKAVLRPRAPTSAGQAAKTRPLRLRFGFGSARASRNEHVPEPSPAPHRGHRGEERKASRGPGMERRGAGAFRRAAGRMGAWAYTRNSGEPFLYAFLHDWLRPLRADPPPPQLWDDIKSFGRAAPATFRNRSQVAGIGAGEGGAMRASRGAARWLA